MIISFLLGFDWIHWAINLWLENVAKFMKFMAIAVFSFQTRNPKCMSINKYIHTQLHVYIYMYTYIKSKCFFHVGHGCFVVETLGLWTNPTQRPQPNSPAQHVVTPTKPPAIHRETSKTWDNLGTSLNKKNEKKWCLELEKPDSCSPFPPPQKMVKSRFAPLPGPAASRSLGLPGGKNRPTNQGDDLVCTDWCLTEQVFPGAGLAQFLGNSSWNVR